MAPDAPILHVEDDENDVFLVSRAFRKAQIPTPLKSVSDGQQAVDYLSGIGGYADRARFPLPQLLLLDLKLPGLSGFEVLAWLRSEPRFHSLPVFILSSSDQPQDMARARELGANRYFVKTPGFEDVLQAARELLREKASVAPV